MGFTRRFTKRLRPVARNCQFCETNTKPDYRESGVLSKYLTERGKMLGQARNGLCSRHQRGLTVEIKRARHLALLPYLIRA